MMPRPIRTLMLTATLVAAPAIAVAQSPAEIVGRMMERYSESTANIDNLLVEQDVMGMPSSIFLVKELVDGGPMFVPQTTIVAGNRIPTEGRPSASPWSGSVQGFRQMADRFELEGTEDVDGRSAYRLVLDDFSGFDMGAPLGQDMTMQPSRAVFLIDRDRLVMLRMEMDAEIVTESGEPRTVHIQSTFSDYRDVEGMLHPFLTSIAMEGMMDAIGGGDPDELRSQLEEMERQLESMTGPGRDMAERMMGPQIERLRDMLGGAPMEIRVTSIRANVDPPGD